MLTQILNSKQNISYFPTNSSTDEVEITIKAVYKQVLGNAHVMESERLISLESKLKNGEFTVREFVRQLAKSELYRRLFFDNCPRYRSIELNFKHLLVRAPSDYTETFDHSQILDREGFFADIDAYIDSDEYQSIFGENIVPYTRGYTTQTGQKLLGFVNMSKLSTSHSTSDKAGETGNSSRVQKFLMYNNPTGTARSTDVQTLLNEVFKPKPKEIPVVVSPAWQPTNNQAQKQESIQSLEKRFRELQTLASIGSGILGNWSTNQTSTGDLNTSAYKRPQNDEQIIASLKSQIADLERIAAFAETQINKWRSKTF